MALRQIGRIERTEANLMSITSMEAIYVAGFGTIVALLLGTYILKTNCKRSWLKYFRNLIVVLVCSFCMLVTFALIANRPMRYVTNIEGLFNAFIPEKTTKVEITDFSRLKLSMGKNGVLPEKTQGNVQIKNDILASAKVDKSPEQTTMVFKYKGEYSGVTESIKIWLPRGFDPNNSRVQYNVIEFIHGFPGTIYGVNNALLNQVHLQNAIDQGIIPPTIMVIPEGNVNQKPPICADNKIGHNTSTWLGIDVPRIVRSLFPNVSDNRKDWLIAGASAGAYCAGRMGIVYGDVFGASAILSGYNEPLVGAWIANPEAVKENALSTMLTQNRNWPLKVFNFSANLDHDCVDLYKAVKNRRALPGDSLTNYTISGGGHNWGTWEKAVKPMYEWWGKEKQKPDFNQRTSAPVTYAQFGPPRPEVSEVATFELMGTGTITVVGILMLLALGYLVLRYNPAVSTARPTFIYLRTLLLLGTVSFLIVLFIALIFNRHEEFFPLYSELWTGIMQAIETRKS